MYQTGIPRVRLGRDMVGITSTDNTLGGELRKISDQRGNVQVGRLRDG